jgi:hypothetical protein
VQISRKYRWETIREATNKAEAKALLEDGFDYVMDKGGASLFRKLK